LYSSVAGKAGMTLPGWGFELSPYGLGGENTALWEAESRFHTCKTRLVSQLQNFWTPLTIVFGSEACETSPHPFFRSILILSSHLYPR
jgi:hypothetical protein